ncbi:tetratricopeptide repeat protein [Zwartia vadi]|uniref:tetratricopeptide repeat protein n=1 Tax=Zwartia vadi TaxID=3058168 RepID=UPI0025B307DA|nr:tetratricopeptide repeat protein [Zwartia vadi]MDN3988487.1 tetratricopeptide repeat protein [Zwartia vadi]
MKSSFKSIISEVAIATLIGGIALSWAPRALAQASPGKSFGQNAQLQIKPRQPESEIIRLRAGELPEVSLTSTILFRILASEISAQRGTFLPAAKTMLDLSRELGDYRLARRALEFYLAGGNLPGALDASRVWLRLTPDDPEASSTEMALAAASGQTSGLAAALRKQIDAASDKSAAIGQAFAVLSRMPDKRAALRILSTAIGDSNARHLAAGHMALADMARAAGDNERALEESRLALAAAPRSEDAAMRVFEYGLSVDPERALRDATEFAALQPNARRLRVILASHLAERGQFDAAMAELTSMLKRNPEDFDLLFMQAQVAYRAKKLEQARGFLDQYVAVQAQRLRASAAAGATDAPAALAEAYQLLSRIAEEQGQLDEAVSLLAKIDDPSMRYTSRIRQAIIRAKQNRVQEALALIDSANAQTDEEIMMGASAGAQILRDANRLSEAIKRMQALDLKMPDSVNVKYELAMLHERADQMREAERLLRQVIALDPGHAHAHNALGYSLADRNQRLPEALALITRALEISPRDPYILDSMGWVKFRMGHYKDAVEYLQRAYSLRPEAEIAAHLGEALWQLGDQAEARKVWAQGVTQDASNKTLQDTLKRFGVRP